MQSNFRLASALMRGAWFIEENYAQGQMPLIERLLAGELVGIGSMSQEGGDAGHEASVHAVAPGGTFRASRYRGFDEAPEGSVAVIPMSGVIMREDYCGDIGTDSRLQLLRQAAASPNIACIVVDVNSPGGEASGLASLYDAMAQARTQKPVLGFVNDGIAASAGYYGICGADEIYVSHPHCGVGSIGCVLFLTDTSKRDEAQGVRRIAVYAPQSTEKNQDIAEALAGRPGALQEGMLQAWCADFIGKVQLGRGAKLDASAGDPLKGKMYWNAAESQAMGLIDGVKTFQEVVARGLELAQARSLAGPADLLPAAAGASTAQRPGAAPNATNEFKPTTTMSHVRLLALLGLTAALEMTTEGTHLQAAHLAAIEGALEARETAETALATAQTSLTAKETALSAATARADKADADLAARAKPAAETIAPKQEGADRETPAPKAAEIDPDIQAILDMKAELGIPNTLSA